MTALEFGKRISDLRNEKKLTQLELAEKLNVSTQAVSKWETGVGFPDIQTIPQISHILDTTTDYLLGCTSKQQKILVFNVQAYVKGSPSNPRICEEVLNNNYLSKGWKIVQSQLSSQQEQTFIMVVLERNN